MNPAEEIMEHARQLFLKLGLKSVTMDDIANKLGISKKTIYQHFSTKDELIQAVVVRYLSEEEDKMEVIQVQASDALDEMRQMSRLITANIEEVSPVTLYDLQKYYRRFWEFFMEKRTNHAIGCIVKNLARGVEEGLYRSDMHPEIVARIYSRGAYMIVDELSNPHSTYTRRQLIEEFHNYHVHGIATPRGLVEWQRYAASNSTTTDFQ